MIAIVSNLSKIKKSKKIILKLIKIIKNVIRLDVGHVNEFFVGELITKIIQKFYGKSRYTFIRIAMLNTPEPTSLKLTKKYYLDSLGTVMMFFKILDIKKKENLSDLERCYVHNQPGEWFKESF